MDKKSDMDKCPTCGGTGEVPKQQPQKGTPVTGSKGFIRHGDAKPVMPVDPNAETPQGETEVAGSNPA